jgi:DNA-binding NarL/FixJ family response regulator
MRTLHTLLVSTENARRQVRPLLDSQPDIHVVAYVASLREACEALALLSVDLVVFESKLDGADAFELLPAIPLKCRVICLTGDTADALRALNYGSLECVPMPVLPRIFHARLDSVRKGQATDAYNPMDYFERGYGSIHCPASITT